MEEEDPEEDLIEEEPIKEEDPSEEERIEEADPGEDSEVSEGKLMESEDLERDFSKSKMEALERENSEGDQEERRVQFIVEVDQMRGPELLSDEIDPTEKRVESEIGVTRWKRGRCGRMCRGTCPLDTPNQ